MDLFVAFAVFPIIFLGELPDKSMFASLIMATRGRPSQVWLGTAAAFLVHVVIATTIGVALFRLLPRALVEGVVAAMFLLGAVLAWRAGSEDEEVTVEEEASRHGVVMTAFLVTFIAEWGDLTQILTANLAARYRAPLSVGIGATLALWAVAGIAVAGGQTLLRYVNLSTIRKVTAAVLLGLAAYSAYAALR